MKKELQQVTINTLKIVLPLGIGIYLMWYFYNSMDTTTKDVFFDAIFNANPLWILLALFLGWLSHVARAYRWKYMLNPLNYSPNFWHRYHAVMIGYIMNLLIPRAGEVSRAGVLYQTDRIPFSKSFGTIIGERVFDLLMLGLILLLTLIVSFEDIINVKNVIINSSTTDANTNYQLIIYGILLLLGVGIIVFILLWIKSSTFKDKIKNFFRGVIQGVFSILESKKPLSFIFYTFCVWGLYLLSFAICFQAFEITTDFPLAGILVGFIAGTFGIAFTNGGIGAYPYLVGIVVMHFLSNSSISSQEIEGVGKALGMTIWLSQTILIIILGIISFIFIPRNFKKEKNDKMGNN